MVVPLIIAGVLAAAFLALWVTTQQKLGGVRDELSGAETQLSAAKSEVASMNDELDSTKGEVKNLQAKTEGLESELTGTSARLDDANDTLRKRTELADAQALQIDALSGERDDLREEMRQAEEKIASMAARPGVVVGDMAGAAAVAGTGTESQFETEFETLWNLELARTERLWRNSVAIDPTSDHSPLDEADNPLRQAIEIEAAALREDVGALIDVDWQAEAVDSSARRLVVLRLAQEMLASAARAPGATKLLISNSAAEAVSDADTESKTDDLEPRRSEIRLEFVSVESDGDVINLIPPAVTGPAFEGILDIRQDGTSAVVVTAGDTVVDTAG